MFNGVVPHTVIVHKRSHLDTENQEKQNQEKQIDLNKYIDIKCIMCNYVILPH